MQTCPEVFRMEGDLAVAFADPVPADAELAAKQAADDCPTEEIKIQ